MPAGGLKVVIREVENTLFFSNLFTVFCSIDPDTGYWRVKYIIPTSAIKVRKYTHVLQYSQIT